MNDFIILVPNKSMKLKYIVILILILLIISAPATVTAYAEEEGEAFYVVYSAKLYENADLNSGTLADLGINDEVFVLNTQNVDGILWAFVRVEQDKEGYILMDMLYQRGKPSVVGITKGYLSAKGNNQKIQLYLDQNGTKSNIVLTDGTSVEIIDKKQNFTKINYEGSVYYVNSDNVTTGMTYYQSLALIIGLISVSAVIIVFLLSYLNNNVKKR